MEEGDDMDGEDQDDEEMEGSMKYSGKKSSQENSTGRRDSSEALDDEEMGDGEDYENGVGDLPSPPEMKRELIQAILDETEEYRHLKAFNDELQRKICFMDLAKSDGDRQSEQLLNEHKYQNTLANVHQVRFNLKET